MAKLLFCFWVAIILAGFLAKDSIALDNIIVGSYEEDVEAKAAQGRAYVSDGVTGALIRTLDTSNPQSSANFGDSLSVGSGDVNGDGKDDIIVGAPRETVGANTQQGRVCVSDGATGALIRTLDTSNPQSSANFGCSVGSGDVNGDGKDDIIAGAPRETVGANLYQGRVYVSDGATGAPIHTLTLPDPESYAHFGDSVGSGDVNGDGKDDIIVGADFKNVGANADQGQVYVFNGVTGALIWTLDTSNPQSLAFFGSSVGSGDVNGDGKDDIIVGALEETVGANLYQGRVYVFDGATGAPIHTLIPPNPDSYAYFGCSVGSGDVNNDGKDDIIVGAFCEDVGANTQQGRAYVFNGVTGALIWTLDTSNPQSLAFFGSSVGSGDVNGDGKDDIIVGAPDEKVGANTGQGRAYIFDGLTGACIRTLTTPNPRSEAGFGGSVSSASISSDIETLNQAFDYISTATASHSSDLPTVLQSDVFDIRNNYIVATQIIAAGSADLSSSSLQRQEIYDFYINLLNAYPALYQKSTIYNKDTQSVMAYIRERTYSSLIDSQIQGDGLNDLEKTQISSAMDLSGRYLDIWNRFSVLLLDNNKLSSKQKDFIYSYLDMLPTGIHNLHTASVLSFLGDIPISVWSKDGKINIFGDEIGTFHGYPFPDDVSPVIDDRFCSAVAHEINHIVDHYNSQISQFADRKAAIIFRAGCPQMYYLRSMFEVCFFQNSPQEFFASIANQYFSDSGHTLDLGVVRFQNGYKEPINQFLFYANTYSKGTDQTYFYKVDFQGIIQREAVFLERDVNGYIKSLIFNGKRYDFTLDSQGYVQNIAVRIVSGSVALQAANGQYLCAEGGGGDGVVANRNAIGAWETFKLLDQGNGKVALQAANGQYLCAEGGGGDGVVANRNAIGAWETFTIVDRGNGYYALRASNGQYVCAEGGGGDGVVANRNAIGAWETLRIMDLRRPAKVALQAANGQYVCAEGSGGGAVVANRNAIAAWETFKLLDRGNGNVALQAANGQYVCAEGSGGGAVVANRNAIAAWETFRLLYRGNGNVALRVANGQYVCTEGGGGDGVVANRNAIGTWETFKLIPL
ncbi:MAG: hypothetical protein QG575_84 [Euryarchaeota archaeon]|nr:hypothetical protein [Euryarchaeota archaeon]